MAGSYFEMGVAVWIKNHKFRFPNRQVTTFSANEAAGQVMLSETANLLEYGQRGDTVILGKSTESSNAGKAETAVVASIEVSPNLVNVKTGITYPYDSGDQFVLYGSKFPNNWTYNASMNPQTIIPSGGGASDRYAAYLTGTNSQLSEFQHDFDNLLLESVYYRFGCYYKFTRGGGGQYLLATLNDGDSNIVANDIITTATTSSWTRYDSSSAWQTAASLSSEGHILFKMDDSGAGGASSCWIDDVFVEHADGINNNGMLLFDEVPLRSTLDYDYLTESVVQQVAPGSRKLFIDAFGDKTEKKFFQCRFQNINNTMWQGIQELYRWQMRGNLLNFHPFINIDDLPGVMTGVLTISNMTKSRHYDMTLRSFDFLFTEV